MFLFILAYILMYTILQEFVILKLYKVNEKRKKCFIIIFIYTMFFLSLEYYIGTILSQNPNEINALVYNICHMIYTFVTIAVIGTFAEGIFPWNFIKLFLYLWRIVNATKYWTHFTKLVPYIFEPEQISITIYEGWFVIPISCFSGELCPDNSDYDHNVCNKRKSGCTY